MAIHLRIALNRDTVGSPVNEVIVNIAVVRRFGK